MYNSYWGFVGVKLIFSSFTTDGWIDKWLGNHNAKGNLNFSAKDELARCGNIPEERAGRFSLTSQLVNHAGEITKRKVMTFQ